MADRNRIGYVVIEWRQTGGYPYLATYDVFSDDAEAGEAVKDLRQQAASTGRRDRFVVAEVIDRTEEAT